MLPRDDYRIVQLPPMLGANTNPPLCYNMGAVGLRLQQQARHALSWWLLAASPWRAGNWGDVDAAELRFLDDFWEMMRVGHYKFLGKQEWESALSEDFMVGGGRVYQYGGFELQFGSYSPRDGLFAPAVVFGGAQVGQELVLLHC